MQEQLRPAQSGTDALSSAGVQYSSTIFSDCPPSKKHKTDGEYDSDEDMMIQRTMTWLHCLKKQQLSWKWHLGVNWTTRRGEVK